MKIKPRHLFVASLVLFYASLSVQAQSHYWDGADTTANADGGSGTWDTSSANWDTTASGGADIAWPTSGTANIAVFSGTAAGTVSVGLTTIDVAGLTFSTTGYKIQGNTIRFNASGNIKVDPGVSAEISSSIAVASTFDITVLGGGTLNYAGLSWQANKFTVNGGTTVNWSGSGSVGGGNNYVGLGNSSGSGVLNVTGGSLTIAPSVSSQRSFFIGSNNVNTSHLNVSGGIVTVGNNARIRIAAGNNDSNADTSATAGMITVSGTGVFTTGTTTGLLAVGSNSFDTATINLNQGGTFATLRNFTTGTGATAAINFNGGTLRANGNVSGDWIASGITTNILAGGAKIDSNGFNVTINRALLNVSGTDGGLTKSGPGTLTLGGSNTYNGPTSVSNGALVVNGNITTSAVTVNPGATIGGSGTLGGSLSIGSGGFLAPGNSAGNLTLGSGLDLEGTYVWELAALSTANPGIDFDMVTVTNGSVDLTGASLGLNLGAFSPSAVAFWQSNQTWTGIINNTGVGSLTGSFAAIDNSAWASLGSFSTTYSGNDVNLVWTAVPEPRSAATVGILGMILLLGRRRCRTRS